MQRVERLPVSAQAFVVTRNPDLSLPLRCTAEIPTDAPSRIVVEIDTWFRDRVQEALDDPRPGKPHDQVMQEALSRAEVKRRP
ncbi:hypothetical protein BMI91_19505 [Thioclava sediminum]|uniref:Stability determinant domain-containing protein n=1 Tax=Thioclava sediminum TaxID=1915319 RepID=A0ABX3MRX6_9RHOB|nr:hypothetical protein BMI91_19505 [Thioclava sediminum]